jgi:hypothetical protein
MPGRARKLIITERQQAVLQTMVRSGTCPQAVAQRARMILLAFDGLANEDIARQGRSGVNVMRSAPGGAAGPRRSSAWSWSNAARSRPHCRAPSRGC